MRLLFLTNLYPPFSRGGFEGLCKEAADELERRGHTVRVLTSQYDTASSTKSGRDGVIRDLYLEADIYHYRIADFFLRRPFQERANARVLRSAMDQFSPDLVVVWGMWNLSRNLPYWAEQWFPGRVAYYIADIWPMTPDAHEQYWQRPANRLPGKLAKRILGPLALSLLHREGYPPTLNFEHALCCSQYIRDELVDASKLPGGAGVLYHGIEPDPFFRDLTDRPDTQNGPLRLLYFGRLVSFKGVHTAIEAMGVLNERGLADRVELTVVGGGHPEYEAELRASVARLGIGNRVHFTGRVPWDELLSRLKNSDVMLFTTIGPEAMARTVMEAMAAGLLVIGTQQGGQGEMLFDGENALAFEAGNPLGLADCIARVLDQPPLRHRLARAGQQMVLEQFTLTRMVDDMEEWLKAIAG